MKVDEPAAALPLGANGRRLISVAPLFFASCLVARGALNSQSLPRVDYQGMSESQHVQEASPPHPTGPPDPTVPSRSVDEQLEHDETIARIGKLQAEGDLARTQAAQIVRDRAWWAPLRHPTNWLLVGGAVAGILAALTQYNRAELIAERAKAETARAEAEAVLVEIRSAEARKELAATQADAEAASLAATRSREEASKARAEYERITLAAEDVLRKRAEIMSTPAATEALNHLATAVDKPEFTGQIPEAPLHTDPQSIEAQWRSDQIRALLLTHEALLTGIQRYWGPENRFFGRDRDPVRVAAAIGQATADARKTTLARYIKEIQPHAAELIGPLAARCMRDAKTREELRNRIDQPTTIDDLRSIADTFAGMVRQLRDPNF